VTSCQFTATLNGVGDFVVSAATVGHATPENSNVIDGKKYTYYATSYDTAVPPNITGWEAGSGIYIVSSHTLKRTNITANSDGTSIPVNFLLPPIVDVYASPSGSLERPVISMTAPDVIVEEQQAGGTGGGTATSGSWFTRVLNILVRNAGTIASLATNQVTLGAGTYYFSWSSPCGLVDSFQSRLFNVTDSTVVKYGTNEYSASSISVITRSIGSVTVTIAASKTFRIEHQVTTSSVNAGALGVSNAFGVTGIFSRLEITKLTS
jgi:hypothetical protein